MGHSIFSVSIVEFVRGKLRVLSETSDRVGGRDMDECLMREFAAQFQKKVWIQQGGFNQQPSRKKVSSMECKRRGFKLVDFCFLFATAVEVPSP